MLRNPSNNYNGYYAFTAYNSNCPRPLVPVDNSKFGFMARTLRRNIIASHGCAQCCEFFWDYSQISIIGDLNSKRKEVLEAMEDPGQEVMFWQTMRNPKAVVDVFTKVVLIFAACAWCWFVAYSGFALLVRPSWFLTYDFLTFLFQMTIPSLVYLFGKFVLMKNWLKDKNNVLFNRRKGTISIPGKNGQLHELPFDEFDGYIGSTVNPSGSTDYHLILANRYSASFAQHPGGSGDESWKVCADWELLLQYMDISKPLPDIPCMEPYRHRDPVTAEYDRMHRRPKGYWKTLDLKVAEKYNDASRKAASQYPWGLTREQALTAGWQPSGVGEGDWRNKHNDAGQPGQNKAI